MVEEIPSSHQNFKFGEEKMLEEFADRIQNAKDKQFKIFERFHIGDAVYPFWLNNFVVYGIVVDIDTVARKIICDFNGIRRQFCPEDLMLVNPAFIGGQKQGKGVRTADWKNSFNKKKPLSGVKEKDADNGIKCVCKECGGEIAVSYDERSAKTDFVCTQCGKRISEDKVSKKCKDSMRKAFLKKAGIDKKDYAFYVQLDDGSIESGWEYKEDAKDRQGELNGGGIKSKVYTREFLEKSGKSPKEDANWHKGRIASGDDESIQMVADALLEVAKTLTAGEEDAFAEDEEIVALPYKTKGAIHNFIHGIVDRKVKGLHRDSSWEDVQAIWKELERNGMRPSVSVDDGGYSADGKCKTYRFEFKVKNSQGKEFPISGQLCCFAAGTVEDPWESYDMTFQIF